MWPQGDEGDEKEGEKKKTMQNWSKQRLRSKVRAIPYIGISLRLSSNTKQQGILPSPQINSFQADIWFMKPFSKQIFSFQTFD